MIPQPCSLLAVRLRIPFFHPKIVSNSRWSVCWVNFRPWIYLWNFFTDLTPLFQSVHSLFSLEANLKKHGLCGSIFKSMENNCSNPVITSIGCHDYFTFSVKMSKRYIWQQTIFFIFWESSLHAFDQFHFTPFLVGC